MIVVLDRIFIYLLKTFMQSWCNSVTKCYRTSRMQLAVGAILFWAKWFYLRLRVKL